MTNRKTLPKRVEGLGWAKIQSERKHCPACNELRREQTIKLKQRREATLKQLREAGVKGFRFCNSPVVACPAHKGAPKRRYGSGITRRAWRLRFKTKQK